MNVSVSPEAERELIDGAAFYAERADRELGLAFIAEFEHARDLLSTNPEIGAQWGIAHVAGDRIILDGTTIEEIQDVQRETLVLVVDKVNELIAEYEARKQHQAEERAAQLTKHKDRVSDVGSKISFD